MFNLDGRRMHVTHTAADGEVNAGTIFAFDQQDDIVSAQYSGGPILKGYLVGRLEGSKLEFRYAQINVSGKLDGGHSRCDLELTPTGQIRLIEHFEWESRAGGGSNIFEELASP